MSQPDRNLDRAVAEWVFGIVVHERDGELYYSSGRGFYKGEPGEWQKTLPEFSSDSFHAGQVVAEMDKLGFLNELIQEVQSYVSQSSNPKGPTQPTWKSAKPKEICEAAIRVLQRKKSQQP